MFRSKGVKRIMLIASAPLFYNVYVLLTSAGYGSPGFHPEERMNAFAFVLLLSFIFLVTVLAIVWLASCFTNRARA
jgi:hypothetical protein